MSDASPQLRDCPHFCPDRSFVRRKRGPRPAWGRNFQLLRLPRRNASARHDGRGQPVNEATRVLHATELVVARPIIDVLVTLGSGPRTSLAVVNIAAKATAAPPMRSTR